MPLNVSIRGTGKIYQKNCLPSDSLGLEIRINCPIVQFLGICLDSAVSNMTMVVGQCFVTMANIWTVLCPIVQWLVYAVSNCPMACELSVQQSNGQNMLFPTV